MPIPFQQDKLLYNVHDTLPLGVGFSRVFNNTASTLLKFKALNLDSDGVRYANTALNLQCHGFAWEDINPNEWGYMAHDTVLYQQDWFLDTQPSSQYLTQGATYYLGTLGNITLVAPTSGILQELGHANSISEFVIEIQGVGATTGAMGAILSQLAALQTQVTTLDTIAMKKPDYDADNDLQVDTLDEQRDVLTVTTTGQTAFTLSRLPLQQHLSELSVNGQQMQYGVDYTIVGTALTYTGSFPLETTDNVEITFR